MSETPETAAAPQGEKHPARANPSQIFIHRVCIQCNNMFRVPADKFDAKQCPNCHKG